MKTLILYATNSGATFIGATIIEEKLKEKGWEVTVKRPSEIKIEEIKNYELVIVGSNSWMFEETEGHFHEEYVDLFEKVEKANFSWENIKVAIFGMGDATYTTFCGAVDLLEKYFKGKKAIVYPESLRIDRFFDNQFGKTEKIVVWTNSLIDYLASTSLK